MKDFPSCFAENAVQVADSSSSNSHSTKHAHNLVLCVYQCIMEGKSCLISITWSKSLMGQGLSVGIDDSLNQCLCKVDIKPGLFSKRSGCKSLQAYSSKVDIFWDFSSAKFGVGPEPLEGFYVCVVLDRQIVMFLGDLKKKAFKKTNAIPLPCDAVFVAKKEHVFGKRLFSNKAVFCDNGQVHDLEIECDTSSVSDLRLEIRIDSKTVMQVKRLKWKFRGNCTILVDGFEVEVLWDVYNWLFGNATSLGNAVFMFRTCLNEDKWWGSSKPVSDENMLQSSLSKRFSETKLQGLGFSLMLYAWKNE